MRGQLADLIDFADVGVIEGGLQPRLANEALDKKRSGAALFQAQAGMDDLQGDKPVQPRIEGLVYGAHAP